MPSTGSKVPSRAPYFKLRLGEWAADAECRGKISLSAVSAGITIPVEVNSVSSAVLVSVDTPVTCTPCVTTVSTTGAGTVSVLDSLGTTTAVQVLGFSVFNACSSTLYIQLRFGATAPFWGGGLPGYLPLNWNFVQHRVQGAVGQGITCYLSGAGTVVTTVYYRGA